MGNIFDILGPVMIGPSSSHTAGAAAHRSYCKTIVRETARESYSISAWLICCNGERTWNGQSTDRRIIGDAARRYADSGKF